MKPILYIDDDYVRTQVMLVILSDAGYTVKYCKMAEEASEAIQGIVEYAVVILDLMLRKGSLQALPGDTQTGHILYRQIRKSSTSIPIIILTALGEADRSPAMRGDEHLRWVRKPQEGPPLIDLIREVTR
jgi:CheY-like chemotaxis protein